MKTELVQISKLKLLEHNPRRISKEQMDKLCKSIENDPKFLECRPILVSKREGVLNVYGGNQRVRAAKKLKMKEIPCIVEEFLTDEVIKERIVKDNAHYGNWDWDELANGWDMEMLLDCGFNIEELVGKFEDPPLEESKDSKEDKESKVCETCGKKI